MPYNKRDLEITLLNKNYEVVRKADPLLGQIQTVSIIHGGGMLYEDKETKKQHSTNLKQLSTSSNLRNEIIIDYKIDEFSIFINEFIVKQLQESAKMIFDETSAMSEFTGNVINNRGAEFNYDNWLSMIEKIAFNFDKNGDPILPTLFCGKNMLSKLEKMKRTNEQEKKYNQIMQTKKEQWYANKHYRKLSYID